MAKKPAQNSNSIFENQSYLYLLMRFDATPFNADGAIVLHDTPSTLDFSSATESIATFKGKGPNSTAAFEESFAGGADVEDSALNEFIGETFEDNDNIFVWVFNPVNKAWAYLGEIKAERTYKLA